MTKITLPSINEMFPEHLLEVPQPRLINLAPPPKLEKHSRTCQDPKDSERYHPYYRTQARSLGSKPTESERLDECHPAASPRLSSLYWDQRLALRTAQPHLSGSESPTLVGTDDETEVDELFDDKSKLKDSPPPSKAKATRERKHICQICQKKFVRPSSLIVHIRTHTGDKPYPCPVTGCKRDFNVRSNMRRHLKTHSAIDTSNLLEHIVPESKGRYVWQPIETGSTMRSSVDDASAL